MARKRKFRLPDISDAMTVKNPRAAAADVGSRFHAVAVPPHLSPQEPARLFGCTTPELREVAAWLLSLGITTVALESTGNYWVPLLRILEAAGLHVILVHPEYARQAKRTKFSDLDDAIWLQQMHAYGLLPPSFQPPAPFHRLRALWRYRETLVADQAREVQRMQNALELMNLQLHKAISDITGVTGLTIIRAIVRGDHAPLHLVQYRDPQCKCTEAELIKALTGDYREEELFVLGQVLSRYDFCLTQLTAVDAQIDVFMQDLLRLLPPVPSAAPVTPRPPAVAKAAPSADADPSPQPPTYRKPNVAPAGSKRKRRSKREPAAYDWHAALQQLLGVDATRICGLSVLTVLAIIAEIGTDLSPWDSVQRFTSWLGLAPNHQVSGGKVLKRRTRRGKPHAAHPFYVAALAAAKSQTPLGNFYRYQKGRLGPKKALTATARKIAVLYYNLLKYGPDYVEHGQQHLQEHLERRKVRQLHRLAKELGVTITAAPAAA